MKEMDCKRYTRAIMLTVLLTLALTMPQATPAVETASVEHERPMEQVALQSDITLVPTWDTILLEAHPTVNYGNSDPEEYVLGRIDGARARALLVFNIGKIPLGATIDRATLRLYQHGWYDAAGSVRTIWMDRVTSGWHEAVATWSCSPATEGAVGSVNVGMSTGWYEVDLTGLAREWYAGTAPNYGLLLRGHEGSGNLYRLFTSRLYVNEPQLVVEYTLQPTTLEVSPDAIRFMTDGQKTYPSVSLMHVSNSGTGVMTWTVELDAAPWLNVSPSSGSTSASYSSPVETTVLIETLTAGTYTAPLTITAPSAQNSPQVVNVTVDYSGDLLSTIYLPLAVKNSTDNPGLGTESQMVAVLVGIRDYQHLDPPPAEDARTGDWGYDTLFMDQNPDHTRMPLNAFAGLVPDNTRKHIDAEAALDNLDQVFAWADEREEKNSGPQTKVVFAYGGHGGPDAGGTFLITAYDTDESGGFFSNAIPGATLDSWLDELESEQVLVVIDACYSGGLIPDLGQSGRIVLTAADSTHSAWEVSEWNGGVFTHYFVQALMDPGADTSGDGWVSAEEAYAYAAGRVDAYVLLPTGSVQNPQMYDGVSGELLLTAPTCGGTAAVPVTLTDEMEPAGAVRFASRPVRLPMTLSRLR